MKLSRTLATATVATLAAAVLAPTGPATAAAARAPADRSPVETVAEFDFAAGEAPEGLVIDSYGRIYTGFALSGEIRRIDPDGSQHSLTRIDTGGGLLLGLTIDHRGDLLAAVRGGEANPAATGIWRITPGGTASLWVPLDPSGQPNGIDTDRAGNTYVGDSIPGRVWRITPDGRLEEWASGRLLAGLPDAGQPGLFGANGVLVRGGSLYVANLDRAAVIRIPIRADGSAGRPQRYVQHPSLLGADDLVFDVVGNLYVTTDGFRNSLVRVTPWRSVRTIASGEDGLDSPAQLKFGRGRLRSDTLFIANIGGLFGRAAVRSVQVPFPG